MTERSRIVRLVTVIGVVVALAAGAGASRPAAMTSPGTAAGYRNGLIAFTRCCGPAGIDVIRPDGKGLRRLYRAVHDDAPLHPAWSPDGRRVAFVPGAERRGLWTMEASGAGQRRVTPGRGDPLFPSWSPTGTSLVFADLGRSGSGRHDLYVVRVDGSGLRRLTNASADETHPAWASNGGVIAYERGRDVWQTGSDGRRQRLLVRAGSAPAWSPGATHLAFIRRGDPWVVRRDGTGAKRVADLPADQLAVAWSPDGRWLVTAPIDRGDLTLVRADGSVVQPLTRASDAFHGWPAWQRLRAVGASGAGVG